MYCRCSECCNIMTSCFVKGPLQPLQTEMLLDFIWTLKDSGGDASVDVLGDQDGGAIGNAQDGDGDC